MLSGLGLGKTAQGRLLPVEAVCCSGLGRGDGESGDLEALFVIYYAALYELFFVSLFFRLFVCVCEFVSLFVCLMSSIFIVFITTFSVVIGVTSDLLFVFF
jgi:hypothetical protein